jgi:hypothetical protein
VFQSRATSVVLATLTIVIAGAGSAYASARTENGTATGAQHCVVSLIDRDVRCYSDFRQAIAAATAGRITDAPHDVADAVADKSFESRVNAPVGPMSDGSMAPLEFILSIEYEHRYRGGNGGFSATFTADSGCIEDGQRDFELADIRDIDPWWNDRISSFQGYNTCDVNHYEHSSFNSRDPSGDSTGPKRFMDSMGDMNDETTSLTWG